MVNTRKTPARLSPDGGRNTDAVDSAYPIGTPVARQASELSYEANLRVQIQVSAIHLESCIDISNKPPDHLHAVLGYLWCPNKPVFTPWLKFWKVRLPKKGESYEYWVEDSGTHVSLGKVSTLISQPKFRRAVLEATEGRSEVVIPHYEPDEWYAILKCLLKVFELREEGRP